VGGPDALSGELTLQGGSLFDSFYPSVVSICNVHFFITESYSFIEDTLTIL